MRQTNLQRKSLAVFLSPEKNVIAAHLTLTGGFQKTVAQCGVALCQMFRKQNFDEFFKQFILVVAEHFQQRRIRISYPACVIDNEHPVWGCFYYCIPDLRYLV